MSKLNFFQSTAIGEGMSIEFDKEDDSYILAYWERCRPLTDWFGLTFFQKLWCCWRLFRRGSLWTDMLLFDPATMKRIAYHILYQLEKNETTEKSIDVLKDKDKLFS